MSDKIYCYPNLDVLINKLNIHDSDKLREAERKLTMLRLMDLLEKPITGKFDFEHLRNIPVISEAEMVEASIDSFICDYKKMETLFTKITEVR